MSEGYVFAGYGVTVATLGLYALRVLRRGRNLRRTLDGSLDASSRSAAPAVHRTPDGA
ncbi:MAG TPA: hypothetical protein VM242_14305 [Acidimicrobiales bacterium]|jgi:hypothetical protein|nr:hypothetical protein [Acidimicrobiales bacterium]